MRSKVQDRKRAIVLRKQGKSYREIQERIPVSKGTLSKWFANLPITSKEEKFLKERSAILQDKGRLKTALKNRERNEKRRDRVRVKAKIDFRMHKDDPFFVLGLSLYWAGGAKRGDYFSFSSSDVEMLRIMIAWVQKFLHVEPMEIRYRLYIHESHANEKCERFWSRACEVPLSQFQKTIYQRTPHNVVKSEQYKGCLRMVTFGVDRLITVETWQMLLSEYYVEAEK